MEVLLKEGYAVSGVAGSAGTALAATGSETVPGKTTERQSSTEPPYKVILHNDDLNSMEHVVAVLIKVIPRMSEQRAVSVMIEAHTNGQAVAKKCHKELAELYEDRLRSEGLIATIEPD